MNETLGLRIAITGAVLAACLAGSSVIRAREPEGPSPVTAQQLFDEALAGDPGKEVVAQTYVFPAGAVLPWHAGRSSFSGLGSDWVT